MSYDNNPVGKAQQIVLNALGVKAYSFMNAEEIFSELGLVVRAVRQGRSSVPSITVRSRQASGFTEDGEGETWTQYANLTAEQSAAIAPYVAK